MRQRALSLEQVAATAIMDLKATRRELEFATVRIATVQAENRRLRRMTANGRQGRILARASADAKQIITWRWAGWNVSRAWARSYEMSRTRWAWAVALLERARVVRPDARPLNDAFVLDEYDDAIEAIDRMVRVLSEKDDGLVSLAMKLPKNGRRGVNRSPRRSRRQSRN